MKRRKRKPIPIPKPWRDLGKMLGVKPLDGMSGALAGGQKTGVLSADSIAAILPVLRAECERLKEKP